LREKRENGKTGTKNIKEKFLQTDNATYDKLNEKKERRIQIFL
jgi:hypothetical protein